MSVFILSFFYLFIYLFILICLFTNLSFGASVVALSMVIHNCFLKHWRFPLLLAVSAITEGNKEEEEEGNVYSSSFLKETLS